MTDCRNCKMLELTDNGKIEARCLSPNKCVHKEGKELILPFWLFGYHAEEEY